MLKHGLVEPFSKSRANLPEWVQDLVKQIHQTDDRFRRYIELNSRVHTAHDIAHRIDSMNARTQGAC